MTLLFTRTNNHLPVVQFQLIEGSPCITEGQSKCHNIMNSNITYDFRYRLVAWEDKYSLYIDNDIVPPRKNKTAKPTRYHPYHDYSYNLYQKSYVRWKIEWEQVKLNRHMIYEKAINVETAWQWQNVFSVIWLFALVITGLIFGIINWIHNLCRLWSPAENRSKIGQIWDQVTNTIAIIFAFFKIGMIFIWVYTIDIYEYSIRIMQLNECSDDITNQSFRVLGESLMQSRFDNLSALKFTMLMLTFEAINYLTPIIVDLRRAQMHMKNDST